MKPERFDELQRYERSFAAQGVRIIAGVDEAGRGPLAGPVAAGCVILSSEGPFVPADDSKKLSEKKREALFEEITQHALSWGVGLSDSLLIDQVNILEATYIAMRRAIEEACRKISVRPEVILVDHVTIPDIPDRQYPITHGDALSVTIACASILAKVTRDRLMCEYAKEYPQYGFERHKGYGTAQHYAALREYGPCPIHRRSFLKNL